MPLGYSNCDTNQGGLISGNWGQFQPLGAVHCPRTSIPKELFRLIRPQIHCTLAQALKKFETSAPIFLDINCFR